MKFVDQALERLSKVIGQERTSALYKEALDSMGIRALSTPQEVLEFSNYLIPRGGIVEAIGRAMKVQALLRGAVEEAAPIAKTG